MHKLDPNTLTIFERLMKQNYVKVMILNLLMTFQESFSSQGVLYSCKREEVS